jgi:hypothetical protein
MSTRTIATFVTNVQQNCAWAAALVFTNADASPFDLTNITLTGHFRSVANPGTPLATATFTTTTPASGVTVASLSAHDAGLLPATGTKFNQYTNLVLEIDGAYAADPNNPFRLGEGTAQVSPGGNSTPSAASAPTVPLDTISLVVGAVSAAAARKLIGVNDNAGLIPVAQLPAATAVSPGAVASNLTTALTPTGDSLYVSAAQNNKLASLTTGGWLDAVSNALATPAGGSYCTGATIVRGYDLAMLPPAVAMGANCQQAAVDGGGLQFIGSGGWTPLTQPFVQHPKGASWAGAFDALFPAPVTVKSGYMGFKNVAGSFYLCIMHNYGTSVDARTKWLLTHSSGQNEVGTVLDGRRHTWIIAFDLPTLTLSVLIDGVLAFQTTDLSHITDTPLQMACNADTDPVMYVSRVATVTTL